uniref:Uncharacterized protein n=1 Tax=viral metagenome TaxID=1070528 RepID=A0A6C0F8F7_9ZZZZ
MNQYTSCTEPTNETDCNNAYINALGPKQVNACTWDPNTSKCYTTSMGPPNPDYNNGRSPINDDRPRSDYTPIPGDNGANYQKMNERSEQTLTDIQSLQAIEKELYANLEKNNGKNVLTPEEKTQIINKINEISQMRINLYATLKNGYSFYQKNVASSRNTLQEQSQAVNIVEQELNESKKKLQLLEDEKYNKLRLVEINTYYGKTYNAHAAIMKIVVAVCVPVLILAILSNNQIIPRIWYGLLSAIIIIFGVVLIGYILLNLYNRSNTNFDEYEWKFNSSDVQSSGTTNSNNSSPWSIPGVTCVGEMCCSDGMYYDTTAEKCEIGPDPNAGTTTTTTDPVTGITTTSTIPSTTTSANTTTTSPATAPTSGQESFMSAINKAMKVSSLESFNNYNLTNNASF